MATGQRGGLREKSAFGLTFYFGPRYAAAMDVLRYRGRVVTDTDVAFIQGLIAAHPTATRRALSHRLCEAWNWVQPNGALRDMVCRGLLLALHRAGHIELPPARKSNPLGPKRRTPSRTTLRCNPVQGRLSDFVPLTIAQVRRTRDESLFDSLVQTHHYLGYTQPVGEHLKYLVSAKGVPVACLAWSSAPRHIGCRDRFIGWSAEVRRKNIHLIAYNLRFLILPWVSVPHLASHILGRMARVLPQDWARLYGHPVYFLETFVDPERFRGTCYRAANWLVLGRTTGRATDLSAPIQMCDALSRNDPKGFDTIVANCNAHGRRQFVEVAENFPDECRFVLETLKGVYKNEAVAKKRNLSPQERLRFHQKQSGRLMGKLKGWLNRQLRQRLVEPNSGLGQAIQYMLNHWKKLTQFLKTAGAPLDNNICERALKPAILHRKNALFYKTAQGAHVGDIFMSLIHTCRLCGVDPFDYLTQLRDHAAALPLNPARWMPWTYHATLDGPHLPADRLP